MGVWEERTCIFCKKGVVEIEWHFVMECTCYKDICIQYESSLNVDNMHHLFGKDEVNQIASLLVNIQSRRSDIEKNIKMT